MTERCRTCQYFDRNASMTKETKSTTWGQCRRMAPMLSPQNTKPHMIEGVWPHVRDDDWCGEYKGLGKRLDAELSDLMESPLMSGLATDSPKPMFIPLTLAHDSGNGSNGSSSD
jgi:hypothetical protein